MTKAGDPAAVLGERAAADALALLRAATPDPAEHVDIGAVALVCWTFWFRRLASQGAEAEANVGIALNTFGFVASRVPDDGTLPLPGPLREHFATADPTDEAIRRARDSGFAYVVATAHAELAGTDAIDRPAALRRPLAWSELAYRTVPDGHPGFNHVATLYARLLGARYESAADPEALALAATVAGRVLDQLTPVDTEQAEMAQFAAEIVATAALLLGEPGFDDARRLVASVKADMLTDATKAALGLLSDLNARPESWPGSRDAAAGITILRNAAERDHMGMLACGVSRLREALARMPPEHPDRTAIVAAIGAAQVARGSRLGDVDAAREGFASLAEVDGGGLIDNPEQREIIRAVHQLGSFVDSGRPDPAAITPLVARISELMAVLSSTELATTADSPSTTAAEARLALVSLELDVTIGAGGSGVTEHQIEEFRSALSALPADRPGRFRMVAVLAAMLGSRALMLRQRDPAAAADLLAEAQALTDEVAASAPTGFPPLVALRGGQFADALSIALRIAADDEASESGCGGASGLDDAASGARDSDPLAHGLRRLAQSRNDAASTAAVLQELLVDIRGASTEQLESAVARLRAMTTSVEAEALATLLGIMLVRIGRARDDPAPVDEAVGLLRYAHQRSPEPAETLTSALVSALRTRADQRADSDAAREAAVLEATLSVDDSTISADETYQRTASELVTAISNVMLGFDVGMLRRAKTLASRLGEIAADVGPRVRQTIPDPVAYAAAVAAVVDSIGPERTFGDLTDEQLADFRAFVDSLPEDHPQHRRGLILPALAMAAHALRLRDTDPAQAAALLGQADTLLHEIEATVPAGAPEPGMERALLDWARALMSGASAPDAGTPAAETQPPSSSKQQSRNEALTTLARGSTSRTAEARVTALLDTVDNESVPMMIRVFTGLVAALEAMKHSSVAAGLDHAEKAFDLMARLTDRGSDQLSAEYGLTALDGHTRLVISLALAHSHVRQRLARVGEHLTTLAERKARDTDIAELVAAAAAAGVDLGPAVEAFERGRQEAARMGESVMALAGESVPIGGVADPADDDTVTGPEVDRAVALLERGRGLLLARQLETHVDLNALRSRHPVLASGFERLAEQLAASPDELAALRPHDAPPGPDVDRSAWSRWAKSRASRELDELIEQVRGKDGFADFLRPISVERLRELAAAGPVIVLNYAPSSCHAIVATADAISATKLDVKPEDVARTARRLRDCVDTINARGARRPSPAELVAAGVGLRETLSWTWHRVALPALSAANRVEVVSDNGAWPRVWWIPTGPFNALPLHAAECALPNCDACRAGADGGGEGVAGVGPPRSALDVAVSSYVPGFQILAYARGRPAARRTPDGAHALVIAASETELPGVAKAAAFAADRLGAAPPTIGTAATRDVVLAGLTDATWAHFGCHASGDLAQPSGSEVRLPSGETLSVLEICRARPPAARLAFLAACATARTAERLADEAIHISSAFLVAGFPEVVGTLWEIDSRGGEEFTREFYRRAVGEGALDADSAAFALHHALRELRRRHPNRPYTWAAYLHAGA